MVKTYRKSRSKNYRLLFRFLSLLIVVFGAILFAYTFFPLISWQVYFAPAFASQKIESPVPNQTGMGSASITDLISTAANSLGNDYTDAYSWYPGLAHQSNLKAVYTISIPKINIVDATVSNQDSDLAHHLVQFNSDSIPPKEGNTVIFGHSTLPQLYNPKDYKTIFANAYKLSTGDQIIVSVDNIKYSYKIENITVVEPTDTSVLSQDFSDSFLTIITCTPPGTIWKRLVIKARLEKI